MKDPWAEQRMESYAGGDSMGMLEVEYLTLRELLAGVGERKGRHRVADGLPSLIDLVSELAAELLPHGPAPSLSDALDALDQAYAGWQAEESPFQRLQARTLAHAAGRVAILRLLLAVDD